MSAKERNDAVARKLAELIPSLESYGPPFKRPAGACTRCGCAPQHNGYNVCEDCLVLHDPGWGPQWYEPNEERIAASVSVGMRALCGTPWQKRGG